MAEKKNDATSILAKIRQKMNKIEESHDEINLDDDMQDLSPVLDTENYQPTTQTKSSIKNEEIPAKNNPKFEDDDIFDDINFKEDESPNDDKTNSDLDLDELLNSKTPTEITSESTKTSVEKDKNNIFNDEDLKLDIDLEIEDNDKSEEEQTEEDLDDIDLEELEESDDKLDNLSESSRDQSVSVKQNANPKASKEEQDDDILNFDFLEEEKEIKKESTTSSENKTQSTFNRTELPELDELDDLDDIDDLPKTEKQNSTNNSLDLEKEEFSKEDSIENDDDILEEEIEKPFIKKQNSSNHSLDLEEEFSKEDSIENDDDLLEEEIYDKKEYDKKIPDQNQQSYQQQSKPDMISRKVMDEAQQSIKKLVQAVPKKQEMLFERSPAFRSGETIEDIVISMLRPKLEQWFNENLPLMVEKIVREEIKKIIPKHED